jgi:transposase
MYTIGCDVSKKTSNFAVIDPEGAISQEVKLNNVREDLLAWIRTIPSPKELTLEATFNWSLFYELMKNEVDQIHLAHPKKTRIIGEAEIKNDRLDAQVLARLTRSRFLPEAYISSQEIREMRSLLRFRCQLVWKRTTVKSEIHALVDRHIFPTEKPFGLKSLFTQKGVRFLETMGLPGRDRFILDELLCQLREINGHLDQVESFVASQPLPREEDSRWLKTVPGMGGKVLHLIVLAEIATIHRFRSPDALIHYAGLIPKERSSGEKRFRGRLVKDRNTFLQQALLEAVTGACFRDKGLKVYYQQVKKRAGSSAARVATARKLLRCIYGVLKEQRAYRPFLVSDNAQTAARRPSLR